MADYLTLEDVRSAKGIDKTSNDALIYALITACSRWIDDWTHNHFNAATATRYFDTPDDRWLKLDDYLHDTPTTVTNGDGAVIPSSEYYLFPYNPDSEGLCHYRYIALKSTSSYSWTTDSAGGRERAISVNATCWGYSKETPKPVFSACLALVIAVYNARFGVGSSGGDAAVTASGFVITPKDVPQLVYVMLAPFVRKL